jgi:hypothetical protein
MYETVHNHSLTGSARFKIRASITALVILLTAIVVLWQTFAWEASVHEVAAAHELVERIGELSSHSAGAELAARRFVSSPDSPGGNAAILQ